ncbi:MAG: hypothetical protein Q8L23_11305 [Caulobacter sp.]|nr:hypothetical protein [Caulobacter sp.]
MFHYRVSGLTVASELALPGLITSGASDQAPDIHIRRGAVPEALDGVTHSGPSWQLAGNRFLLRIPDVLRMLLIDGREILFEPDSGAAEGDGAIFLSGSGIGILMQQRGRVVLHASAVKVNDCAVLFCGPSGAGKSTLAVALGKLGYPSVADDFCCLTMDGAVPWLEPDGRQHKLWGQAIDALEVADRKRDPIRSSLQKYFVTALDAVEAPMPVGMIYELHAATPAQPSGIQRPRSIDGAHLVLRNAYRRALIHHFGQRQLYFDTAATLMASGRIQKFTRAMNFGDVPASLSALETHWRANGLLVGAA